MRVLEPGSGAAWNAVVSGPIDHTMALLRRMDAKLDRLQADVPTCGTGSRASMRDWL